jgi:hypothetical protein
MAQAMPIDRLVVMGTVVGQCKTSVISGVEGTAARYPRSANLKSDSSIATKILVIARRGATWRSRESEAVSLDRFA